MHADKSFEPFASNEIGTLRATDGCLALFRPDGTRFWLEMDRIPQHLFDVAVCVEGIIHQRNLIVVNRIGPVAG
jgi:hypothetical protein